MSDPILEWFKKDERLNKISEKLSENDLMHLRNILLSNFGGDISHISHLIEKSLPEKK
jgi:hypothetical protein